LIVVCGHRLPPLLPQTKQQQRCHCVIVCCSSSSFVVVVVVSCHRSAGEGMLKEAPHSEIGNVLLGPF